MVPVRFLLFIRDFRFYSSSSSIDIISIVGKRVDDDKWRLHTCTIGHTKQPGPL